jgi:hypothetical protein
MNKFDRSVMYADRFTNINISNEYCNISVLPVYAANKIVTKTFERFEIISSIKTKTWKEIELQAKFNYTITLFTATKSYAITSVEE